MAYRVSQADRDSGQNAFASDIDFFDLSPSNIFHRQVFGDPLAPPRTPPNSSPFNPNQQHYSNHQLPSIPDLFSESRFSGAFEPFRQAESNTPCYPPHTTLPLSPARTARTATDSHNHNHHGQGRPSWVSARPDATFPRLDSSLRRPPRSPAFGGIFAEQHLSRAPPRTQQQQRSSSSNTRNIHTRLPQPNRQGPEPGSDDYHYLTAIADGDFSSPSLPPINSSPLLPSRPQSSNLPKPLEVGEAMPTPASRSLRATKDHLVDLTKEEPDFESSSGINPSTPAMPNTRKRNATAANGGALPPASKRRRSSPSNSSPTSTIKYRRAAHNPFSDDDLVSGPDNHDGHDTIDLSNVAEVPKEFMAPKVDSRTKLGKFQCVICMDNTSHLTVTHCGHLFCSECLHTALHIDNMKKTCPVCRTKVDPKEKKGKNQKSFYHLELKIMTANKKGKRPIGPS